MHLIKPSLRKYFVLTAITLLLDGPSSMAQVNSTNIAGTNNVVQSSATNSAILAGTANTMGGANSAMIGSANGSIPNGVRNSFIGGGNFGAIGVGSHLSVLISGFRNTISNNSPRSVILGGQSNSIASASSTIAGGENNVVATNSLGGAIGGGTFNDVRAPGGVVPGGFANEAAGTNSFAAGTRAVATHAYSFVWGGSPDVDTTSSGTGTFTARAPGGAKFLSTTSEDIGVALAPSGAGWTSLSDSNTKTGITAIDHRQTLAKLAALPVTEWRYKHDATRRYIGPMAQDFRAAFGLGYDDKHISTIDTDGVTLSAIKGLVEELREQDNVLDAREEQIRKLESAVQELRERVTENRL